MNARWRRWYLTAAIGLTSAVGIGSLLAWAPAMATALSSGQIDGVTGGTDFAMFYAAADLGAADHWADVYSLEGLADVLDATFGGVSFAYPPPFAMALEPLVYLSYPTALGLWLAIGTGSLLFFGIRERWLGLTAVLAMLFPLYVALRFGQFVPLAILFLTLSGWSLARDKPLLAGLFLGLLVLKPQFLLGPALLLVFSRHRSSPVTRGAAASSVGVLAATAALEPDAYLAFIEGFVDVASPAVSTRWDFSISAVFGWLPGPIALAAAIVAAGTLAWICIGVATRIHELHVVIALGLVVSLLISPRVVVYDWSILVIPMAWLGRRTTADTWLAALGATITLASLSGYLSAGWLAWMALAAAVIWIDRMHDSWQLPAEASAA